jgi:site-specific recombinase XerC
MHKKTTIRPVPPNAKPAGPGKVKIRRKDGQWETLDLNDDGKVIDHSQSWYGYVPQGNGKSKEVALCPNKASAKLMLARLVKQANDVRNGLAVEDSRNPDQELTPLVDDWLSSLEAAGVNLRHLETLRARISRMVAKCGFTTLRDLYGPGATSAIQEVAEGLKHPGRAIKLPDEPEITFMELRVLTGKSRAALAKLAAKKGIVGEGAGRARKFTREQALALVEHRNRGLSHRTVNGHLQALKSFCRWAKAKRLIPAIPEFPKRLREDTDRRLIRRAITLVELRTLVESTKKTGVEYLGLSPKLRAGLYLVAFRTLLRARALRELRAEDCHLDDPTPWINVRAETDKAGVQRRIPITDQETVKALAELIRETPKRKPIFPIPAQMATVMRRDLVAAGIEPENEHGCVDVHALRHSGASHLATSKVPLDVVLKIGGWKNYRQFFDRYGHYSVDYLAQSLKGAD